MRKIIWIIPLLILMSACTSTYTETEIRNSVNDELPYEVDLKITKLNVETLKNVTISEEEQRIYFDFSVSIAGFNSKKCRVSGKPVYRDGKLTMTEIKSDKLEFSYIPVDMSKLANAFVDNFFSEFDVFELSGIKKSLVKDIRIEGREIKAKISMF
jgi:hypothetical protein